MLTWLFSYRLWCATKNGKGYYCEVKACTGDIKCFLLVNFGRIYIDKVHVILKYSLHLFLYCIRLPIINGPGFLRLAKKCSDAELPYWSKNIKVVTFADNLESHWLQKWNINSFLVTCRTGGRNKSYQNAQCTPHVFFKLFESWVW